MKLTELHIKDYNQFEDFKLDLTYPEGHPKAGQALDKVCFIGQSGTGKTSLIELLIESVLLTAKLSNYTFHKQQNNAYSINLTKNNRRLYSTHKLSLRYNNSIELSLEQNENYEKQDSNENDEIPFFIKFDNVTPDILEFFQNTFNIIGFPCDSNSYVENISRDFLKIFHIALTEDSNLKTTWALINKSIIEDRELEIKKSLEISKALQNPKLTNEDILKVREEFFNWRKNSPNPIVDLAENFLDKILNRFNLKVKTELDFERKEDIETIKIQTRQGDDIPFDALSTGTKQVILTALPLYGLKPEKAIILFDEPERSLYPDIQKEIVDFYTSMAKDSQFFFATHSPLIASSFEPWEIVELKFNEKGKVYQEQYYEGEKHVDNYIINPQYLTWTGILQKVFDLEQESNPLRDRQLIELATLESQLKRDTLSLEKKKEIFEKYQKLATLLNWE
jgi:ABC-type lipoprotein export system ATPase subunit